MVGILPKKPFGPKQDNTKGVIDQEKVRIR